MAGRRLLANQGKALAAATALAFLVAWHAAPATASSNTPVGSDDVTNSASEYHTISSGHSLAPRIEAALRKAFKAPAVSLAERDDKPLASQRPAITTRVPGISDEQLARYRRLMYRKDI
ncbi:MAG: hypothetical protein WBM80_15815 [Woeseiaceae bacterium]